MLFKTLYCSIFLAFCCYSHGQKSPFTLSDFYSNNLLLSEKTDSLFNQLSDEEKVAQLIMPAIGNYGDKEEIIDKWVKEKKIGGLLLLNGTKTEFSDWVKKYNQLNKELGSLPFLYSADAEPSLINRKIKNSVPVKAANKIETASEVRDVAKAISEELLAIGINFNFAPVIDESPNKTVGWRSFGLVPDSSLIWARYFIQETQKHNIIATAKHFPGHGLVEGDSHKKLVYIKGETEEVKNYFPVIADEVISIMVGHIAVISETIYNTNGLPATISKNIVTDLLRDSLNFRGIIVTDAMNMKGVSNEEDANVKAVDAGVDILLMPLDAGKAYNEILKKYQSDEDFKIKVDTACKRIIRVKLCVINNTDFTD